MQISLLQACQLLEKPTLGTRLLGFQGCLQSSVRTPELLISFLGSYSNLASLLTTWFQFFSGLLIRIFSLNFLMLFHFFFPSISFFMRSLFGNIPSCLISLSCSICLRRLKWERKWEMHVRFQLDGKIWEESLELSCSLWAVESPPTPPSLLAHHYQIPVLYSRKWPMVTSCLMSLGSASTSEEISSSQFRFSLSYRNQQRPLQVWRESSDAPWRC